MPDMTKDVFADQSYGKAALRRMGDVPENFRLFEAGWMEKKPPFRLMEVRGAMLRANGFIPPTNNRKAV